MQASGQSERKEREEKEILKSKDKKEDKKMCNARILQLRRVNDIIANILNIFSGASEGV